MELFIGWEYLIVIPSGAIYRLGVSNCKLIPSGAIYMLRISILFCECIFRLGIWILNVFSHHATQQVISVIM